MLTKLIDLSCDQTPKKSCNKTNKKIFSFAKHTFLRNLKVSNCDKI